jgi:predicted nucleic acid-binding protein
MNLVLDASAGLLLATGGANDRLRETVSGALWVGAPELYDYEVTNTVWKYHRFGDWTGEQCGAVLLRALELIDERCSGVALAVEALALARRHRRPSYDMFYLALARRRDALLASADKKLVALAKRIGVRVDVKLLDER